MEREKETNRKTTSKDTAAVLLSGNMSEDNITRYCCSATERKYMRRLQ
jgi:hypothetical protein